MILDRKGLSAVAHRSERRNYIGLEPFSEKCPQSRQLIPKLQKWLGVGSNLFGPSRHHLQISVPRTQSFFVGTKNLSVITEQLIADKIEKPSTAFTRPSDYIDIRIGKENDLADVQIRGWIFLFN